MSFSGLETGKSLHLAPLLSSRRQLRGSSLNVSLGKQKWETPPSLEGLHSGLLSPTTAPTGCLHGEVYGEEFLRQVISQEEEKSLKCSKPFSL